MNPFELRLGNFVDTINRNGKVHLPNNYPIKIVSIGLFKCRFVLVEQNPAQVKEYNVVDNSDICGVSLTEEWLLRFGFSKRETMLEKIYNLGLFEYATSCKTIDLEFRNSENHITFTSNAKYIHEFQNLFFAITGEELTLKP